MRRFEAPKTPELDIKRRTSDMASFSKWNAKQDPRTELHDVLGLTGAEISINNLPAGAGVPFVHSHKKNEEIYIILSGKGSAVLDGEKVDFAAGDVIRIARHLPCLLVHEQFPHLVLPDAQVLRVLQNLSPFPDELSPVFN